MKITVESTDHIVNVQVQSGAIVPARIWQGQTESGIPVHCFITRIGVNRDQDTSQFERELQEMAPMRVDLIATYFPDGIPLRLVL